MSDQTTTVAQLRQIMTDFVAERQWEPFHDPKNLAASIAIETAELMEHFQWRRSEELDAIKNNDALMDQIKEEVADVTAYLLSFANSMDIDLSQALRDKMIKNAKKYPVEEFKGRF